MQHGLITGYDIYCSLGPTSQLATTDLPEHSYRPGPDLIFPKRSFWEEKCCSGMSQHSCFSKWPFLHYNEAEDTVF